MEDERSEISDVEELKEIFSVLGEEVPNLLKGLMDPLKELMDILYNPEKVRERAKAIASFYRELKDQGLPDELIVELIKQHFENPMSLIKNIISERGREEFEEEECD
ncbi:hypothetical protein [Candidatus Korarchaeum cryptofilum]|uniref:hypothetical protein n=1 Tax=Candidatus Korarchaeum cryptofilum TaxID=498846 RepID=UPI000F777742|nr:hypothetical protein [Candidatus Korarchaeum cryptofilum]